MSKVDPTTVPYGSRSSANRGATRAGLVAYTVEPTADGKFIVKVPTVTEVAQTNVTSTNVAAAVEGVVGVSAGADTASTVLASVEAVTDSVKAPSKKEQALKVYDPAKTRKEMLKIFQEQCGMSVAGANTYLYNFRGGKWK